MLRAEIRVVIIADRTQAVRRTYSEESMQNLTNLVLFIFRISTLQGADKSDLYLCGLFCPR